MTTMRQATTGLRSELVAYPKSFGLALCKAASLIFPDCTLVIWWILVTFLYQQFASAVSFAASENQPQRTLFLTDVNCSLPGFSFGITYRGSSAFSTNRTWRSRDNLTGTQSDRIKRDVTCTDLRIVECNNILGFMHALAATDVNQSFSEPPESNRDLPRSCFCLQQRNQEPNFPMIRTRPCHEVDCCAVSSTEQWKSIRPFTSEEIFPRESDEVLMTQRHNKALTEVTYIPLNLDKDKRQNVQTNNFDLNAMMLVSRYAPESADENPVRWSGYGTSQTRRLLPVQRRTANIAREAASEQKHLSLMDSSRTIRMDQRRLIVVDQPELNASRSIQSSISDRSFALGSVDREGTNDTAEQEYPILSFQYVEPQTIELLVVVTERMTQRFGTLINEYLISTMTTVSSLLRHPSLKTSLQLKIVDIMLLDRNYAIRHNLDDWSYSKQEQVMARFCRWVNRLRRPNFTWDSAILLNIGHFKSTALGVAHYRSMCNVESSCLAVLDRGFGTGYIIAHELGHQLGAKHDFEQNSACGLEEQTVGNDVIDNTGDMLGTAHGASVDDFSNTQHYWQPRDTSDMVRRDTIMSGTLYFDNFPLRWSSCSRNAIHAFLETNGAYCLRREDMPTALYTADWLAKRSRDDLPGSMFFLDQQCQFVLKVHSTRFCGQKLPVCRQLYCEDAENGACLPMEAAWAEGTSCGDKKWCIQGQCVPTTQKPARVNGDWGEWGPWSSCSRTCGGGVRFSERECNNPEPANGGDFCHGTRTRMRSCAIQPCEKPFNIRQHLCDLIGKQYGSHLRAYVPKLGEVTACSLTCLDKGNAVAHGISLPDGTPCYSQRDDICIKGRCWETGCDGVLGSSQRFDRCRVCGGDNSTCVEIKGVFNGESVNSMGIQARGLINAVRLPRGVTNAFVRKVSPRTTPYSTDSYDDFMLLIFEELKTQIRRGETREPFVGAELYYSGTRRAEEIVAITGRLQKDVNIMIKLENTETTRPPPSVEYHYYVDKSQRHSPLYFIAEEEARLASQQANRRSGRSQPASNPVDSPIQGSSAPTVRSGSIRPTESKPSRPRVHFVWRISELPSGCRTCAGNSTSHAECYPLIHDAAERQKLSEYDYYRPVADYLCASMPRPPPVVHRCADYCGVRWTTKPTPANTDDSSTPSATLNTCSARCGTGQQAVIHVCEEYVVPAEEPDKTRGIWRPAQLGERACVKAGLGPAPPQPSLVPCEGTCEPVFWIAGNWSECSVNCGYGERFRQIRCRDVNQREWPLNECIQSAEPTSHTLAPPGAITGKQAEAILTSLITEGQSVVGQLGGNLRIDQSEKCVSLTADCVAQVKWSVTTWSECEPLNDEMRSACRSIENAESRRKTIVGVRQRQVSCQLSGTSVPKPLQSFVIGRASDGPDLWSMQLELCRQASALRLLQSEPNSREVCTQPICYRWGTVQFSECSVTCGKGLRSAKVACERVTVNTDKILSDQSHEQKMATWVEQVSVSKCHQRVGYTPRIFLSADSQSVFVETLERPLPTNMPRVSQLTNVNLEEPIQLDCVKEDCTLTSPTWHTTAWSKCSVPCGTGVRRRQAICMLETHERNPESRTPNVNTGAKHLEAFATVVTATRLKSEVTDAKLCLDHNLPKPLEEEPCFEGPCPQWSTEEWGPCEGTCEFGIQRRKVRCMLDVLPKRAHPSSGQSIDDPSQALLFSVSDGRQRVRMHRSVQSIEVDAERCQAVVPQPVTKRICLLSDGCPYWHKGDWSSCSVNCGIGTRVRQVDCRFPNGTRFRTLDDSSLRHRRSESFDQNRERFDRVVDEMTHVVEGRLSASHCSSPRPVDSTSCKTRPCTQNKPFWWSLMVSECGSETCEVGTRSRVIRCLNSRHGPIDDAACRHLERPANWIPCVPFRCKQFEWREDQWSTCPRECGARMRYRRVHCVDHLGEEYADSLCPAHLKPENWRACPDWCSALPKSCAEVKQRFPTATDGVYQLLVDFASISIYCANMETDSPTEYVDLHRVNYARTAAFMQPSPNSNYCPHKSKSAGYVPSRQSTGNLPSTLDTINEAQGQQLSIQEISAADCPECPFVFNLASSTYYQKLRLDVNTLQVDIYDTRFAYTVGPSSIPFATAKDCFGSNTCPQGRFQIDLRGTGLRVSTKTRWEGSFEPVASQIFRSENGQVVVGRCGGHCAGCWPRPGLHLEVLEKGRR